MVLEEEKELDLIELCSKNPELANSIALEVSAHHYIYKRTLKGIPYALFTDKACYSKNINRIITVSGTLIRAYETLIRNVTSELVCLKCNSKAYQCSSGKRKGKMLCESCGSSLLKDRRCFGEAIPSQKIRIQDIGNPNSMSETLEVVLEEDLAGKFFPGDKILVTGVILVRWKPFKIGEPMASSIYMHALAVHKQDDESMGDPLGRAFISRLDGLECFQRRLFLINSFGEEIQGLENVKLGLLLALVSGFHEEQKGCTRSNSHVLLVGDSGTGKSHLLKTCTKLLSPAVLTNGVGTSQAGLTACAVRQGKEWVLEAGALVLADTGICCIDEFNKLKVNEKNGLLEAMEQQTLSIAKAGIVSSLNTRCSVIAVVNTRHKYNFDKSVSENTMIATPLASRFDLIFGLFDGNSHSNDLMIVDKILGRNPEKRLSEKKQETKYWGSGILKSYIGTVRKKSTVIPDSLNSVLMSYYHYKRKAEGANEFNTVRMLESLARLTEAHSKLLNSGKPSENDVYGAILLLETTLGTKPLVEFDPCRVFVDEAYHNKVISDLKAKVGLVEYEK
ncbi:DNA replication licensing factor Mcm7 [Encephalitozoon intestinalis ATCC 50506]|uniref:DNA helicase n=1 Tax=Encephalitozoon intestinalis (strain ATCC 50506) TaxID=876142 RepID=E0S7X2_ENCIT|nr:DNA replication licensing factor Mcm7 [Encephalitozoon intestinalis ATCC 50506]ADM11807.1 DNA replication licensing factor Mcm7 [Encephalitozoon intestinalis ATCC 50506]UTX45557.1 minichromosome maintenance protein [Encephalitozoon intestinalis]